MEEVESIDQAGSNRSDLIAMTNARESEFKAYRSIDLPHRIVSVVPVDVESLRCPPAISQNKASSAQLQGIGCSSGRAKGPVRVISSPGDVVSVNGHILTALRMDPGWAPLFPTCKGILVERGGTLSHPAAVARELGIPSVVGIPGLMEILRDGETVHMDGQTGEVVRLEFTCSNFTPRGEA